MRKNSIKNVRINSEVMKELSYIIRGEVKDPRIDPMVSVTDVQVAPDLKTCKVYISVLGSRESLDETLAGLKQAKGYIRSRLARTINLRNTPDLIFIADTSIEYGIAMSRKIDELNRREDGGTETDEIAEEGEESVEAEEIAEDGEEPKVSPEEKAEADSFSDSDSGEEKPDESD